MGEANLTTSDVEPNTTGQYGSGSSSIEPCDRLQHVQSQAVLSLRRNPCAVDRIDLPDHRVILLVLFLPAHSLQG